MKRDTPKSVLPGDVSLQTKDRISPDFRGVSGLDHFPFQGTESLS